MIVIDGHEVAARLTFEECIPLMRKAMMSLSTGQAPKTLRSAHEVGPKQLFGVMPGILDDGRKVFGAKSLGIFPDGQNTGRHRHQGVVVLFDGTTGAPVCVADAEEVITIRTASVTAFATERLALTRARRLAIFGCGTRAYAHLCALSQCRSYGAITVWGRDPVKTEAFAAKALQSLGMTVTIAATAEHAARDSNVICTVTGASEPILKGAWIEKGDACERDRIEHRGTGGDRQ